MRAHTIFVAILSLNLWSCSNHPGKQADIESRYIESLKALDSSYTELSKIYIAKIQDDLKYLNHGTRVVDVSMKADKVRSASLKSLKEIDSLEKSNGTCLAIQTVLKNFKSEVKDVDSAFRNILPFAKTMDVADTLAASKQLYFAEVRNAVYNIERVLLHWLSQRVGLIIEDYTTFSSLVGQNKGHFKPGELLQITAGIGAYSTAANPEMLVEGNSIEMLDGVGVYSLSVTGQGLQTLPVLLIYDSRNGGRDTATHLIEYRVE